MFSATRIPRPTLSFSRLIILFGSSCFPACLASDFALVFVHRPPAQQASQPSDAQALVQRAWEVMGGGQTAGMLVHYHAFCVSFTELSIRPHVSALFSIFFQEQESWFNPRTAVERSTIQSSYPLAKSQNSILLTDAGGAHFSRGAEWTAKLCPAPTMQRRYLKSVAGDQ